MFVFAHFGSQKYCSVVQFHIVWFLKRGKVLQCCAKTKEVIFLYWCCGQLARGFVCFLLCSKPMSAHMNAHEAHMSASWAYIPLIWSHINAYLTHRGSYWPQMGSIRTHIKAVLGPYGFLSGAFLHRYVPICYYMKPYWCPVNSCRDMSCTFWVHMDPQPHSWSIRIHAWPMLCPFEFQVGSTSVFCMHECWAHVNNIWSPLGPICKDATGPI